MKIVIREFHVDRAVGAVGRKCPFAIEPKAQALGIACIGVPLENAVLVVSQTKSTLGQQRRYLRYVHMQRLLYHGAVISRGVEIYAEMMPVLRIGNRVGEGCLNRNLIGGIGRGRPTSLRILIIGSDDAVEIVKSVVEPEAQT